MGSKYKQRLHTRLLILTSLLALHSAFVFKQLSVTPTSYVTNVTTTYTIQYNTYIQNNFLTTAWNSTFYNSSTTVTLSFPVQYSLPATVGCSYSINSTGTYTPIACTTSGNIITLSNLFNSTIVRSFMLMVTGVLNPYPAGATSNFTGSIGSNTATPSGVLSIANITTAACLSSFTFTPNYVYLSPANMILTLNITNQFPSNGYITVKFPSNRLWSQDLNTLRFIPITSSMVCNNYSANVISGVQCAGSVASSIVTVTNVVSATQNPSSSLQFSINSLNSPPTNQAVDAITVTTFTSGGFPIDSCSAYVTGLLPQVIPSTQFLVGQTNDNPMVVNQQYTIKFDITTIMSISRSDSVVITFPSGTGITSFATASMGGTVGINQGASTYLNQQLTIYFTGVGSLNPQQIYIYISNFLAPPSTAPTADFVLNFMSNGFPRMTASRSITAIANSLSGTASIPPSSSTVNQLSLYTFSITTSDPITSAGQLKIFFPAVLTINIPASCAALSGSLVAVAPVCSYNSLDNSITFTGLNSSTSSIPSQTLTLTVSGITNPPSTLTTSSFSVTTYYTSNINGKVNEGSIGGITATKSTLDYTKVVISSSSAKNSDTSVSYYVSFVLNNRIASGGFIVLYFPSVVASMVTFTLSAVAAQSTISLNGGTASSTTCSGSLAGTYYSFNFSTPFSASSGEVGTNVTLGIVGAATNPPSTAPFSPFSIFTYYSDGSLVSSLQNALGYATTLPSPFSYNQFSRLSNTNADLTTYTVSLIQPATLQANAKVLVTFPSATLPLNTSVCSLSINNVTTTVGCGLTGYTFTVTTNSSSINGGDTFSLSFSNIRNPLSFASLSGFSSTSRSSNNLYLYSSGSSTNSLQNTIPTKFKNITYQYSPQQLNQPVSLRINFQLSQSTLMPAYLLISIDTYFSVATLACSSFINFVGNCTPVSSNTLKVAGSFNNSVMGISISGFSSKVTVGASSTFSSLASFDSSEGKIDQSLSDISFALACTLPCMSCSSGNTSSCLSCYSNTAISPSIYFHANTSNCYILCPDGTYNDASTLTCLACDTNCLTCLNTATNCTKCLSSSSAPYLNISGSIQICVANCLAKMYPETLISPVTCTNCKTPCETCTSQLLCLSCLSGFFYLGNNSCAASCPPEKTVANNLTNTCDNCSSICLKCAGTKNNCTACAPPSAYFNGSCASQCPPGGTLAPYEGVCTPCNSTCFHCSLSITNCTDCDLNSSFPFFINYACLAACPEKYYNVTITGSCIACASVSSLNCVNCSSASTCLSCDLGFVYFGNNKTCVSSLADGFVNISGIATACAGDCQACSKTTTNCTACKNNNLQNNLCVANCSAGTIALSRVCLPCSPPCATCSINQTNCNSCLNPLTPQLYLLNSQCQQNCSPTTYANSSNFQCTPCVSPCVSCSAIADCSSCIPGKFLYGTSCVSPCPAGYVGVVGSGACQACTENCKTCSGAVNSCLTCVNGSYFLPSSSSCVSSCEPSLFIDYANQKCVGCTSPCDTCVNSSTTCLSCIAGYLNYQNQCLGSCPAGMFIQANKTCIACSSNCAVCTSLTACLQCSGSTYLYNKACVANCPAAVAVIVDGACTACSTQNCATCNSADICLTCKSGFLFFNAVCLTSCTDGYYSNGTHCLPKAVVTAEITAPTTFPVPFSIAGAVLVIACLMSRLQFSQTYLSGAIYSFVGVLEVLALLYFLYLYYLGYYSSEPIPLYIALGALGYLYILNVIACLAQSIFLCYEREFEGWRGQSGFHRCFYGLVSVVALAVNHKIRNILFCKLFTFKIFSAKLDRVDHFKIFNIFSLLSIVHSGAAIFAAAVAFKYIDSTQQIFYESIDVIVLTSLNAVLAFFNAHKDKDFFQEVTPEGYSLHKKNQIDEDHFPQKIKPEGHDGEIEEGFFNDYNHALVSKAALKFDEASLNEIYSEGSMANIKDEQQSSEKEYEEISVQALDLIDEKANVTAKTLAAKSDYKPVCEEISIQVEQLIKEEKKDVGIDLSELPPQFANDSSNFTSYSYFKKVDRSAQSHLHRPANHSAQVQFRQADRSIQNDMSRRKADQSVQGSLQGHDVSVQPSLAYHDVSVSMSRRQRSYGVQQKAELSQKNVSAAASLRDQSNQLSVISQQDEQIQIGAEMVEEGMQPSIQYSSAGVQPTLQLQQQALRPEYHEMAIQYEPGDEVAFNQFQQQLDHTNTASHLLYDQEIDPIEGGEQPHLQEERAEQLDLQADHIKSYQEQLEDRIRQREKELQEVKRKVIAKQRINQKKRHQLQNPVQGDPIPLHAVRIIDSGPREPSNRSRITETPIEVIHSHLAENSSGLGRRNSGDVSLEIFSKQMPKYAQNKEKSQNQQHKKEAAGQDRKFEPGANVATDRQLMKEGRNSQERQAEASVSEEQGIAEVTIEQIEVDRKEKAEKESFRESQPQKTIEQIQVKNIDKYKRQPHKNEPTKKKQQYEHIQYKQYQNELESHEDSEQHHNEQNKRVLDLAFQPRPPATPAAQQDNVPREHRKPHQGQRNQKQRQAGKSQRQAGKSQRQAGKSQRQAGKNQRQAGKNIFAESDQYQAVSHSKEQSELTQKNFLTNHKENVVVDVVQIDGDLSGEQDLELQQQAIQSDPQPTGIQQLKPKPRERSHNSSLEGTIEQIPRHYTKIDNDKTVGNNSFIEQGSKKYPVTSRIGKDDVVNYFNTNIPNPAEGKAKGREMPKQADQADKYHINKLYSREDMSSKANVGPNRARNGYPEQPNTLAMAGRAQFAQDIVKRKQRQMKNPLHTQKWQLQNEDKYVSDQDDQVHEANRKNLVRNNNKNLQNFASHLVLPQESDKQQTSFQRVAKKAQKQEKPVSQKRKNERRGRQQPQQIQVNFQQQPDKYSQDLSIGGNLVPQIPRTNVRKATSAATSSLYNQAYNESQEVDYRGMMLLGQMQQRPNNQDLDQYYKRKRDSKDKRKPSNSRLDRSTEKIYMQRLDRKK